MTEKRHTFTAAFCNNLNIVITNRDLAEMSDPFGFLSRKGEKLRMDFTEKKDIPVRYVDTQKYMEVLRSVMEEGK